MRLRITTEIALDSKLTITRQIVMDRIIGTLYVSATYGKRDSRVSVGNYGRPASEAYPTFQIYDLFFDFFLLRGLSLGDH